MPYVIYDLLMLSGVLEEVDDERDLKSWALAIIESGAAESSANWIDFLISGCQLDGCILSRDASILRI